jgi:tetratricopeptide (TPR) repeat protein
LVKRHWPIAFGAGIAAFIVEIAVSRLLWSSFGPGWTVVLGGFVQTLALTAVIVTAYRMVAQKESAGLALELNSWPTTMLRAVQIAAVWTIGWLLVGGALLLVGSGLVALLPSLGAGGAPLLVLLVYGALAIPIVLLLLAPVWVMLGVAGALSTVHAVRSLENGFRAVLSSLWTVFDQRWRVFWPSYALALFAVALYVLLWYTNLMQVGGRLGGFIAGLIAIASPGIGVMLTFVIERAYAPDLGSTLVDDDRDSPSVPPASAQLRPPPAVRPARVAPGTAADAATPAAPEDVAELVEQELRANRTDRLVELVERGLAADPRFFSRYPDSTIALAKKLAQVPRSDLALRVLQTYLKEHRNHRLHLTAALLVANVLLRDQGKAQDAARFLAQVKKLYPNEPMVDQLIKAANKAIEQAGSGATA